MNKKILLVGAGVIGLFLLILSFVYTGGRQPTTNAEIVFANIKIEDIKTIQTNPTFDLYYEAGSGGVVVFPLSKLVDTQEYSVTAILQDDTKETTGFTYTDDSNGGNLMRETPILNDDYVLYASDRHHFYVRVTNRSGDYEGALKFADKVFKEFGVPSDSMETAVSFSRSSLEDGRIDPFRPVEPSNTTPNESASPGNQIQ